MNEQRERLNEIICYQIRDECSRYCNHPYCDRVEDITDHLLAEGVIVPPVKIGQTMYRVLNDEILEVKVVSISYEPLPAFSYTIRFNTLGVVCLMSDGTRNEKYSWDIYSTKEEAEKALAEREGKG